MSSAKYDKQRVALRQVGGSRMIYAPTGYFELCALYYAVSQSPHRENLVHAVLGRLVNHFGGRIEHVIVEDLENDIFTTYAAIAHEGGIFRLRLRASDGIAISILVNVPFLVPFPAG
jgi:bifunctional DNase/RNase